MNYAEVIDLGYLIDLLGLDKVKELDNKFRCQCVSGLHEDKNPSMVIYKESGIFKCFACGYQGPIEKLVKDVTGRSIEEFLNIRNVPDLIFDHSLRAQRERDQFITKTSERIGLTYKKRAVNIVKGVLEPLESRPEALAYAHKYGLTDEWLKTFNVSYAHYVSFNGTVYRQRLCIPIVEDGLIVSYEGRDITEVQKPKVLYPIHATVDTLFDIDHIDLEAPCVIVEGIKDHARVWSVLTKNVTCVFGVNLGKKQKRLISQMRHPIIMTDGDIAGDTGAASIWQACEEEPMYVEMPRGKDPGKCTDSELREAWGSMMPLNEYLIKKVEVYR